MDDGVDYSGRNSNNTFNIIIMIMKIMCNSYSNCWYYEVHPFKNCFNFIESVYKKLTFADIKTIWFCLNFICSQQYLHFSACWSSRPSADQFCLSRCRPEMRARRTWLDWEPWAWRYLNKCPNWMQWLFLRLDSTAYWPARLQPSNTLTQEFWS